MGPVSATVFTLSGMCGSATIGTSADRSISTASSYVASGSAASGIKSASRPCAFRKPRVTSSEGNTDVVAPSSAPMLAMVARSGMDSVSTPGPVYSITLPTPPLTVRRRSSSRITSLAATPRLSRPVRRTLTTLGQLR